MARLGLALQLLPDAQELRLDVGVLLGELAQRAEGLQGLAVLAAQGVVSGCLDDGEGEDEEAVMNEGGQNEKWR